MKFAGKFLKGLFGLVLSAVALVAIMVFFEDMKNPKALAALNALQLETSQAVAKFEPFALVGLFEQALMGPDSMNVLLPDSGPLAPDKGAAHVYLGYWAHSWPPLVGVPLAAADTVWHLALSASWIGRIAIVTQIAIGVLATIVLLTLFDPKNVMSDVMLWIAVPLGGIVLGSLSSYVIQQLMIWGLHAFGALTAFGGFCCAAGGTTFALYMLGLKVAEASAHGAIESSK